MQGSTVGSVQAPSGVCPSWLYRTFMTMVLPPAQSQHTMSWVLTIDSTQALSNSSITVHIYNTSIPITLLTRADWSAYMQELAQSSRPSSGLENSCIDSTV